MEVNDEQMIAGAAQPPDGEPEPSQPPVIEPDPPVPAEEPPGPRETPDAPLQEPPEEPAEEDAPVEEPPDRHEQETPIQEPPGGPGPMELAGDVAGIAVETEVAEEGSSVPVEGAGEESAGDDAVAANAQAEEESPAPAEVEGEQADAEPVAAVAAADDAVAVAASAGAGEAESSESVEVAGEESEGEQPDYPDGTTFMSAEEVMGGQSTEQASEASVDEANLRAIVEAIVYVTEEPLTLDQIAAALEQPKERVAEALRQIVEASADSERGITVREVAGGFKMGTKPEHHEAVRSFVKKLKPPLKLSLAALETLAVIAYKQPITAPEIMEVRGVQGAGVIKTLLDRKLIQPAGRKAVVGKPILYKTTKEFLLQFGLKDLSELPTLKEFEELRRLAFSDEEPMAEPVMPEAPPAQAAAAE